MNNLKKFSRFEENGRRKVGVFLSDGLWKENQKQERFAFGVDCLDIAEDLKDETLHKKVCDKLHEIDEEKTKDLLRSLCLDGLVSEYEILKNQIHDLEERLQKVEAILAENNNYN